MICYAITDCHGRLDMLETAYDMIAADADGRPARVVFLGDAIDRGPDSKGCIDRLIRGPAGANFAPQINLIGNHEYMMLSALAGDREAQANWRDNGGPNTLKSYGLRLTGDWASDLADFALPSAHADWLARLHWAFQTDTHIFVHAGIPPRLTLAEALDDPAARLQLIWVRGRFLSAPHDFGKHVIHGHSPVGRVDFEINPPFRTNLDTGAVYGGPLTIGVCDGAGRPRRIVVPNPNPDVGWR